VNPAELATAAHHLGVCTGRREICEGAVKKLQARLAEWRARVAKRPAWLGLLITGATESLVLDLERLVATSEVELVQLRQQEQQLKSTFEALSARGEPAPAHPPRPLAKCGPAKRKRS
jgi:hypothetical protein